MTARPRRSRFLRAALVVALVVVVGGAGVLIGRASADSGASDDSGYAAGYYAGLQRGAAAGREEGRTLQAQVGLPADSREPVKAAFQAGYVAGANDAFVGYDGGWGIGDPYIVTVERGTGDIIYRINSRTPVQPGISYVLCADGRSLCQEPRP